MNKEIMRQILVLVLSIQLLVGCTSKQDLGGIATVSALVVALPLIPFAEAYHAVNDTDRKAKAQLDIWRQQFDPVYQKRVEVILDRDPIADAQQVFNDNKVVFMPAMYRSGLYVGLIWNHEKTDGKANQAIIDNDELLTYLQTLLSNDPLHEKEAGYKYHSPMHECFSAKVFDYKAAFNKKMSELSGKYSPNKALKNGLKTVGCVRSSQV
ncbi:hypothetical protein ACOBV9_08730 [Pseudoalteromonas espejiana]